MKLFEALRAKDGGLELADHLTRNVRRLASAKLDHVRDTFPTFTDHSIRHSDGVIEILDWLLPDDLKERLNHWELYFLVASAYVHDIGMVMGCPGRPAGPDWQLYVQDRHGHADDPALVADYVRHTHHMRSEEYVRSHPKDLALNVSDQTAEAAIVGRIASGHREISLSDQTKFQVTSFGNNQLIHRDLLAAYLRLADELDTTAHRTPWSEFEILPSLDETATLEWGKHLAIGGVHGDQGRLILSGSCYDHRVYLRLLQLRRDMQAKLVDLKNMLPRPYPIGGDVVVNDPIPYHEIELQIEHIGYLPINIAFELQEHEIASLIMGERLYGDATAAVRELIQNAIDALRDAAEGRPKSWKPELVVRDGDGGRWIEVSDNGMGMDEHIVRQYFARVGVSYYRSQDFKGDFEPISEFGIGILSCFMLAERIEVETKRGDSPALKLEIESLTEPFIPHEGQRTEPGTTVRLLLKPDFIGKINLVERVQHFAPSVNFAIRVIHNDKPLVLEASSLPSPQDLAEFVWDRQRDSWLEQCATNPREFADAAARATASSSRNGVTVSVTLPGRVVRPTTYRNIEIIRLTQEGLRVDVVDEPEPKLLSSTWVGVDLSQALRFALTADRTRVATDRPEVWDRIRDGYSESVESLYGAGQQSDADWWPYHTQYYGYADGILPKPLATAFDSAPICTFVNGSFGAITGRELTQWSGNVLGVGFEGHSHLGAAAAVIPRDTLVVVRPKEASYYYWYEGTWRERRWYSSLFRAPGSSFSEWLRTNLYKSAPSITIAKQRRFFLSLGTPTGWWRIPWKWAPNRSVAGPQPFDAEHPFSQLLLRLDLAAIPRSTLLEIDTLFSRAHTWNQTELTERQAAVAYAVKPYANETVSAAVLGAANLVRASGHICPYRRTRSTLPTPD